MTWKHPHVLLAAAVAALTPMGAWAEGDLEASANYGVSPTGRIGPAAPGLPARVAPVDVVEPVSAVPPGVAYLDEDAGVPLPQPTAPVDVPSGEGPMVGAPPTSGFPAPPPGSDVPTPLQPPAPPVWTGPMEADAWAVRPGAFRASSPSAPRLVRRTSGDCSPDCGQRRDNCCWPLDSCGKRYGRTTITLEGSFGLLTEPEGLLGTTAFGAVDQFDWSEVDYEGAIGGRATIEHAVAAQQWLQVRGTYYGSWDGSFSRTGVFGFLPGGGFPGSTTITDRVPGTLTGDADFFGAEFNHWKEVSCSGPTRWDFLIGVRYLQFDENARADFPVAPIAAFTGPAFAASAVENMFIGAQLGARWHAQPSDNFEFMASLKVLAGNLTRTVNVTDQSIFAGGPHAASSEDNEVVLGADVEVGLRLRLSRTVALTAGYNLVLLDSVVRAANAMDFSQSASGAVQAGEGTDQLIWHGVFAGLQFNF